MKIWMVHDQVERGKNDMKCQSSAYHAAAPNVMRTSWVTRALANSDIFMLSTDTL